ncbi:MAG: PD40 domain-containing protein, partial [Cytophagales bacterium]|nr:PD40 domain-containing protein [Cytophaga sp.]
MNRFSLLSIILLCSVLLYTGPAFGQKKKSKSSKKVHAAQLKGDKHYNLYEYYLAAQEYKLVLNDMPDNMYCTYRLAECYREYFDYASAEKYYKKVLDNDLGEYPLSRFWYAIMLRDNGRYEAALKQFNAFLSEYKETTLSGEEYKERAKKAINGLNMALVEMNKPQRDYSFKCLPSPVNTEYSEYSPVIYGPDDSIIVFTSSRKGTMGNEANSMLGGNLSDNYRYVFDGKSAWTEYVEEDNFIMSNSIYNESPGSFTADGTKFYFTRCDEKIAIGKFEDYNCIIYVMKKGADGKWGPAIRLNVNINMKGQWNSQPSVSPDGKILFFTSKRPGGIGMHDIWYATSGGDDNWGQAYNLGQGVNTLFSDMSPRYYGDERLLYFASNGHDGFGGLDVFVAREDENFENVLNVGMPFNSHRDDFYYVLGKKKGYLSSNRQGGVGNDDIYTFNVKPKEEALISKINSDSIPASVKSITIVGVLVDDKGNKASNVDIALTDENNVHIKVAKTNDQGVFRFDNLPSGKTYKVVLIEKDAKVTQKISLNVDSLSVQASE